MYQIDTDRGRNLITVALGGMLSLEETAGYIAELRGRFIRDRFRVGYRLLLDVSECSIQSQDMIGAMRDHMVGFPKASRIAVVTGSSLARMQVRRVMTQSYAAIFDSRSEAMEWLSAEPVAA